MSAPPLCGRGHSAWAEHGARCKLRIMACIDEKMLRGRLRAALAFGTQNADPCVPACQGASEAAELALATPAAGAAVGALARLPLPAALKFLRQMRPGVAQAALAALQARALPGVWMHSHE